MSAKLSGEESQTLYALLKQHQRPLHDIVADFHSKFPSHRRFTLCYVLVMMLEVKNILDPTERIIAFAILFDAYSSQEPSSNPFINSIVNASDLENFERAFIRQLLGPDGSNKGKEFLKQSAADCVKGSSSHDVPPLDDLQRQFSDKLHLEPYRCLFKDSAVKNVVPDPDIPPSCDPDSTEFDLQPGTIPKPGCGDKDEAAVGLLSNLSVEGLCPRWIRPLPPRLPVLDGELVWLNPDPNHQLMWDCAMNIIAAARGLIAKALTGSLAPKEHELLVPLAKYPKLLYQCGLTPTKLPELVEKNPLSAVAILTKLINSPERVEYFTVLVNMDISPQSMDVMKGLTIADSVVLPSEFIHMYIDNCISSCAEIKDNLRQEMAVGLFCAFLERLVGDKVIDVDDVSTKLRAFCHKYRTVREAYELYWQLKPKVYSRRNKGKSNK